MFRALLPLLASPAGRKPLRLEAPTSGDSVREAVLLEEGGTDGFPVTGGVPRLRPSDAAPAVASREAPRSATAHAAGSDGTAARATVRAFERQWRAYGGLRRIFGKDAAAMARNLVNARVGERIRAPWYRGKTVLDAGCGHGRYLRAFADLGATVVGVDAGTGPESAGVPLDDPRIHLVQGDVLALPFRDGVFDLAFCDGVLHHTPDPRRGFAELARVVRPGGAVYAWLYPREGRVREAFFGAARALTTRLPGAWVPAFCFALAPATALVRSYSGTSFPRATWAECAQVVHDWLAPPLQSHHTQDEIEAWAREEGLAPIERLPVPVGVVAWKARA